MLLIAPATANVIAKMANGIADDALTSRLALTKSKALIAPAMNGKCGYMRPRNKCRWLKRERQTIGPEEGMLSCGYEASAACGRWDQIAGLKMVH